MPSSLNRATRIRTLWSIQTLGTLLIDIILAAAAISFLVYGCLVYLHRETPVENEPAPSLLKAAAYGPTTWPILFSAIVGRFLKAVATAKMETGARVVTLEYLLGSRTVFSTVTSIFDLRSMHSLLPLLLALWALSPLGGQASLRAIGTKTSYADSSQNLSYLAYISDYAEKDRAITPMHEVIFNSMLATPAASKLAPQDIYGNIKIPLYDTVGRTTRPRQMIARGAPSLMIPTSNGALYKACLSRVLLRLA